MKENEILLGCKKRGFGKNKWNGYGGKVQEGESITQATLRELHEESLVKGKEEDLTKAAELEFTFTNAPKGKTWDQRVHVYILNNWEGEPEETEEMRPEWFSKKELPYEKMWDDDKDWLPLVMNGKKIKGQFVFGEDNNKIQDLNISEVNEF